MRLLYHLPDPALAEPHLTAWLAWASRSKLKPFVKLARTLRARRDGILAAIRLGLSNGRMEGLNSKVRLLSHRSFGFHGPKPLIALIYRCCTGLGGRAAAAPLEQEREGEEPVAGRSTGFNSGNKLSATWSNSATSTSL
ncbi:MAG: transposase [Actinobacteria bacterium]|nr:transposase [Actinomycetota bacterium]